MNILQAIILGIVQGVSEWLPISSKSHLIIAQQLLGVSPPIIFDLILNVGSFVVVLAVFWKDIRELVLGVLKGERQSLLMLLWLFVATIPIVIIGYLLKKQIEGAFNNLYILGFGFIFTAIMIALSRFPRVKDKALGLRSALVIGVSQVLAVLPGVSRSGTTISTGMMLGVKKDAVARFSFLLFIPTIAGAILLEVKDIGTVDNIPAMVIGTLVAMVAGFISLRLLLDIIEKNHFHWFSVYCAILGIAVLLVAYKVI